MDPKQTRILVLSASPINESPLQVDVEYREMRGALERANLRDRFELQYVPAVRIQEWRRAMLDWHPQIVHFSGHGEDMGLLVLDERDQAHPVSGEALAGLFQNFQVECVVLNACYSEIQARAIHQHVKYLVGMRTSIGDRTAINFAVGFYDALFGGRSVEQAFEIGRALISQPDVPVLLKPLRVYISCRTQDPDLKLARDFEAALRYHHHEPFLASTYEQEDWATRVNQELETADYVLLLLSRSSVTSDFLLQEVRKAWLRRDVQGRPIMLPVRVNFPAQDPLNYDLRGYLAHLYERHWTSPEDTPRLLREILELINREGQDPPVAQDETPLLDSLERPPLPVAEPELPRGQVALASELYVRRDPIEEECFQEILKPGALVVIRAARQMGKTSLMARILHYAELNGCRGVVLTLQQLNKRILSDLDELLLWLCGELYEELGVSQDPATRWQRGLSPNIECTKYLRQVVLPELDGPLVLALDEVDLLFNYPQNAQDFFGMLRAWHEMGKRKRLWQDLRLIVVHSTEPYVLADLSQSPFNVGLCHKLPEFNLAQIRGLAGLHGILWSEDQLEAVMQFVGGHPYLIRTALYEIQRGRHTLETLMDIATTERGPYRDHLKRLLVVLMEATSLTDPLKQVVAALEGVRLESKQAFGLESLGLTRFAGKDDAYVVMRCELYRRYFQVRL